MKHVICATKQDPAKAAEYQDIICYGSQAIAQLVDAKGGASPIFSYIENKCDIPEPTT